jgi:hypothetical protein
MNRNLKIIGIGSIARVGKDSLAKSLYTLLTREGYVCRITSLASALKNDCADFLKSNFDYDVWTDDTEEKRKFRDFLVLYGKMHRMKSLGRHWTQIVENSLKDFAENCDNPNNKPIVGIVPDIRYSDPLFPEDEAWWVQQHMKGIIIDVDRTYNGIKIPPANADEEINSERIKRIANYLFEWETIKGNLEFENTFNGEIFEQILPLYDKIKLDYLC